MSLTPVVSRCNDVENARNCGLDLITFPTFSKPSSVRFSWEVSGARLAENRVLRLRLSTFESTAGTTGATGSENERTKIEMAYEQTRLAASFLAGRISRQLIRKQAVDLAGSRPVV